jgi:hypothetical protein
VLAFDSHFLRTSTSTNANQRASSPTPTEIVYSGLTVHELADRLLRFGIKVRDFVLEKGAGEKLKENIYNIGD